MPEESIETSVRIRRPIAFLYPPQPLKICPLPGELLESFPQLATFHEEALDILGWAPPLQRASTLSWPLHPTTVEQVRGAQVGVVAFSWAATQLLAEAGLVPDVVFGHSLGLHSALVASGATLITDTLAVVDRSAQFLATKHDVPEGAMVAVTGFTAEEIVGLCEKVVPAGTVFPAIVNSRRQVVVSGLADSIKRLAEYLREKQAWGLTEIPGRLPLHTPLMEPLAEACAALIEGARCHIPHIRLIHPTTAEVVHSVSGVEWLWRGHLLGMIDFVRALEEMERLGVATYIEIGVGETLARLCRWFRRDISVLNVGKPELLERVLHARVG